MIINDQRDDKRDAWFVVFTDSFMSGWGGAEGGRSIYALEIPIGDHETERIIRANGKVRHDMKRPRLHTSLKALKRTVGAFDHLSIVNQKVAGPWYRPGGFD